MYLFDIDGTLLLSGGAGSIAINEVFFHRYGVRDAMNGVSAGGKTDAMILRECARNHLERDLSAQECESILQAYVPLLRRELLRAEKFHLMPSVVECLNTLYGEESYLGIATGNIKAAAELKLSRAGLSHFFQFGGFGCDSPVRADLVAMAMERGRALLGTSLLPRDFVVVGDTVHDIQAARHCGARIVAVATGHVTPSELHSANPDAVLPTLADLPKWHSRYFRVGFGA